MFTAKYANQPFSSVRKGKTTLLILLFEFLLFPLTKLLARLPAITPNHVSGVVFLLLVSSGFLFFYSVDGHYFLACLFFILGALLDTVDGSLARLTSRTSLAGKVIDLVVDRLGLGIILLGLAWNYSMQHPGEANVIWATSFAFYTLLSVNTIIFLLRKPAAPEADQAAGVATGLRGALLRRGISFPPVGDYELLLVLIGLMPMAGLVVEAMVAGAVIYLLRLVLEYLLFWK